MNKSISLGVSPRPFACSSALSSPSASTRSIANRTLRSSSVSNRLMTNPTVRVDNRWASSARQISKREARSRCAGSTHLFNRFRSTGRQRAVCVSPHTLDTTLPCKFAREAWHCGCLVSGDEEEVIDVNRSLMGPITPAGRGTRAGLGPGSEPGPDFNRLPSGAACRQRERKSTETSSPQRSKIERALHFYDNWSGPPLIFQRWHGFRLAGGSFPAGAGTNVGMSFIRDVGPARPAANPNRANRVEIDKLWRTPRVGTHERQPL